MVVGFYICSIGTKKPIQTMNRVNDVNLVQTVTEKSPLLLCGYLVGKKIHQKE